MCGLIVRIFSFRHEGWRKKKTGDSSKDGVSIYEKMKNKLESSGNMCNVD